MTKDKENPKLKTPLSKSAVEGIVMPEDYDERPCPNCAGPEYTKAGPGCNYHDLEEREKCVDGMIKQT